MRRTRALLAAIPFGVAVLAPGSAGRSTLACPTASPCASLRLPASITIAAGRGTYRIARDGHMRRVAAPPSPYPKAAAWFPGTGTWYMLSDHRLVIGRGHDALWRSRRRIPARWRLGVIAAGSHGVAFQFEHQLYVARLGGAERPVARRELPLGWTRAGLYTYSYRAAALLLRSGAGRLIKVIAREPVGSDYYVDSGSLYFIGRGQLMSAHGKRVEQLSSLKSLGLSADSALQPLGRFVELEDNHRLVVLRDDASVLAATSLPPGRETDVGLVGSPAVAPRAGLLAFATVTDQSASRRVGTETVYVLRSGAHRAVPVHSETGSFGGCVQWVSLQWHGKWLLYGSTQRKLAVIDTTGGHRAIELTSLVRRLPGAGGGFGAYWTGQPLM